MKIHSHNEWSRLREIYVGQANYANWPSNDPVFQKEMEDAPWKETPPPSGPVEQWVIDEANEDLASLCDILEKHNVVVHRPTDINFQERGGMHNYCPRDRWMVAGNTIVDPAMMIPSRDMEHEAYAELLTGNSVKHMPRGEGMIMDAANVVRANNKWIMLESPSGNREAYTWLCEQFPEIDIELVNFYAGVHIDSTISLLNDHTALVNAARVTPETLPETIKDWDIIWVDNCVERSFHSYPYASKWIGVNCLSIDSNTVIVDNLQTEIITILERKNFTVIPHELRHSRTLGGGYHCVTLDTWRQDD